MLANEREIYAYHFVSQAMKLSDPLLIAWDKTAQARGDPAILDTDGNVLRSFEEIQSRSEAFADEIQFLQPGEVVAIQIGNHPDWPSILLACLRRDLVVLPLDRSISEPERELALDVCRASALVAGTLAPEAELTTSKMNAVHNRPDWGDRRPVLLKLTSGTTAAPRAIRFRSHQLIADCDQICRTMGITKGDLNFGVIPISHSYGFSNLLTPLIVYGIPVVLSNDRVPRAVLTHLDQTKATVFPGMPVFYQAFCDVAEFSHPGRLRLCISAGAPLPAATAKRFREKFGMNIHSFYGSSECGGICFDRTGETLEDGFVGEPMEGVNFELFEPGAKSSLIRVRSAAVADDYFPDPDPERLSDGTFVPDDLLARHGNGYQIVGRISDVINVAGKKVNPAEVEAELVTLPEVRSAIVFGRKSALRNEEVAACVITKSAISESELLKHCRSRLSAWQVPKRIFIVDEMPVNERGKTSRRDLAIQFADR
jgi:long-chain acyl-CoA synthetase